MKTKILKWSIVTLMLLCMTGLKSWAQAPIPIGTPQDLKDIGNTTDKPLNGSYYLTNDIDFNDAPVGFTWSPIGMNPATHTFPNATYDFIGTFDGKGFSIKNLTYTYDGTGLTGGLFGRISNGSVTDLELRNFTITGSSTSATNNSVGALAAALNNTVNVQRVSVIGCTLTAANNEVGGIAGRTIGNNAAGHTFIDCFVDPTTTIIGGANVGGLIGNMNTEDTKMQIKNCYVAATIKSTTTATAYGVIGGVGGTFTAPLTSVFVMAQAASGTTLVPFGTQIDPASTDYFACSDYFPAFATTSPSQTKTLLELQDAATYTAVSWDFDNVWTMDESGTNPFPILLKVAQPEQPEWIEISTAQQLIDIGASTAALAKKYKLMNDIDLSGDVSTNWLPIGMTDHKNFGNAFIGTLDGQNHAIKNLKYTYSGTSATGATTGGIFGRIAPGGRVCNLELRNLTITGSYTDQTTANEVGALAAEINSASIEQVAVIACTLTGSTGVGGLAGNTVNSGANTIKDVYIDPTTTITGFSKVGGIVGNLNQAGSVVNMENCYVAATIKSTGTAIVYGLIGGYTAAPTSHSALKSVFVMAKGTNLQPFCSDINNSTGNYFACTDQGYFSSAAPGTAVSLSDLRTQNTYDKVGVDWDFNVPGVWKIAEGKFPIFQWQSYPALVIGQTETKTISDYVDGNYGDIIFVSDDDNTGQLDLQGKDLTVSGVVKFVKPFTKEKWYAVGFPFDVASVNTTYEGNDYTLKTFNELGGVNDKGDFWLKTYDGNVFNYYNNAEGSESIDAGGYVLQVPAGLDKLPITFTSESGITLEASTPFVTVPDNSYVLTNNPSFKNVDDLISSGVPGGSNYYTYDGISNFGLNHSSFTLKPFESLVIASNITGSLRSSLGTDAVTALPSLNLPNDKVIATEYYNLMGIKVAQPAKGNIYVIKTIFESGKTSVVKQFIENN